jgi:hypothetical protein
MDYRAGTESRLKSKTAAAGSQADAAAPFHLQSALQPTGATPMANRDQRSNKMVKKPKKDNSPPKEGSGTSDRPMPPTTTVLAKGKLKNKS